MPHLVYEYTMHLGQCWQSACASHNWLSDV